MNSDIEQLNRQARIDAIEYLSYGAKTSGKVRDKLRTKGYSDSVIAKTINELELDAYLKDSSIMQAYWVHRSGSKRESVAAFCIRMSRLGIAPKTIEEFRERYPAAKYDALLLEEYLSAKHEEKLMQLANSQIDKASFNRLLRQIVNNCAGRGFRQQTIIDVLRSKGIRLHD